MIDQYSQPQPAQFTERGEEKIVRRIAEAYDIQGLSWLKELFGLIAEIENSSSIKIGEPFKNLSYHFVTPGVSARDGEALEIELQDLKKLAYAPAILSA